MAERRPLVIVSGAVQELPSGDTLPGATPGADGKTILYGTAAPTTEGVDGDFYIRTSTNFIYGPKVGGTWPAGVSLVGPQGPAGADGADGADGTVITVSDTAPSSPTTNQLWVDIS